MLRSSYAMPDIDWEPRSDRPRKGSVVAFTAAFEKKAESSNSTPTSPRSAPSSRRVSIAPHVVVETNKKSASPLPTDPAEQLAAAAENVKQRDVREFYARRMQTEFRRWLTKTKNFPPEVCCMSFSHPVRHAAVEAMRHPNFETLILFVIIFDSISYALIRRRPGAD